MTGCGHVEYIAPTKFGVQDDANAALIVKINAASRLRTVARYEQLVKLLNERVIQYQDNPYAISRLHNELADLYSHQELDIEMAIELDSKIVGQDIPENDFRNTFVPKSHIASQEILASQAYLTEFIAVSSQQVKAAATRRLSINRQLLSGVPVQPSSAYDVSFLEQQKRLIENDISSTYKGTAERHRIYSRLVRVEYELLKLNPLLPVPASQYFENGELPLRAVDLNEIDFLSLAEYFRSTYSKTGKIQFAELALETVYRPYQTLRDPSSRWKYNKIISEYISTLISANFQAGRFDEMLYYVSLNKSRMLLEEGIAFNSKAAGTVNIADLTARDGIPRTPSGLPEKEWFKKRLAAAGDYLDFYVGGKFGAQSTNAAQKVSVVDRSTMPLNVRDFGVESNTEATDNFDDDSLYLTQISGGKIVSAKRISGNQLKELKGQLNDAYLKVSDGKLGVAPPVPFFQNLRREARFPTTLRVSPDKWMAKHPLDYHLGTNITRAVNLFTANESDSIQSISVGGFFNPTTNGKPLPGSEQEAAVIKGIFPASQLYVRDAANISTLKSMAMPTVLHLSMHGQFNPENPRSSRLAFAGAIAGKGVVVDDPNSLYAKDMASYSVLRDRDLIFAAACQTGLSAADQANENELTGILRPLTANRNKNIILSLWKVDDEATRDFVSAFYQRLSATRDVRVSFHHAQSEVRDKYKLPYYWAAFYLSQTR